ncbi:MAG: cytosine deaminase [Myxococcales bacterium]|nr:cytosine deaminase [Myxococcales bacterium]
MNQPILIQNVLTINREHVDVLIEDKLIKAIQPHIADSTLEKEHSEFSNCRVIAGQGALLSSPFVDAHFHLDATLSLGRPRLNESGTLFEGIQIWAEQKPLLSEEDVYDRAKTLVHWAIARGTLAMRTHVDIGDPQLKAVRALLSLRKEIEGFFDLQIVAFPQDGYLRQANAEILLNNALDLGIDVVGGIPHFERSTAAGRESIEKLCRIAADRGLRVDMHCDETDDPQSRHIETLAEQTIRFGLQGRVTASHVTSLHSAPNDFAAKLIPLLAEAQVHVVANPLINITLQGRRDSYPRRRGMTRVDELIAGGVNVAFGHDCVMDPWYALGSADLLEVAQMGLHVGQLTSLAGMEACFQAVTQNPAQILGLKEPSARGFEVGDRADLVLLDASSPIEAIRLRANRRMVMSRGQIIAETPRVASQLKLPNQASCEVLFQL